MNARDVPSDWRAALTALEVALGARPGVRVQTVPSLLDPTEGDAWLLVGPDLPTLRPELDAASPGRLARTFLVGPTLDFGRLPIAPPGSVPEALETYGLAGAFAAQAPLDWREAPCWFAGPKDRMARHDSNALKAAQSRTYAVWFAAPGASLSAFLTAYVAGLDGG